MEQKNWSVVRKLIGYGRYESEAALVQLNRVYDLLRIWTNFWQPSLKLIAKERDDATGKSRKNYDDAQTPYRRVLASGVLDVAQHRSSRPWPKRWPPTDQRVCDASWPPLSTSSSACRNAQTSSAS